MKILIVTRYMGLLGGAENLIKEFVIRLKKRGIGTSVIALNVSEQIRSLCPDTGFITPRRQLPYMFRSTGVVPSLGIVREIYLLRGLVRRHAAGFDLINAHNFPANWVAGGLGRPVVWMCNEVPDFYNNPAPSPAIRLMRSAGIALDRYLVARLVDQLCVADAYNAGRARQRYRHHPRIAAYGIEYDFFAQSCTTEEIVGLYGLDGHFVAVQVGMISPQKDQMKSIQAVESLAKEIPRIKLVLAGRPQEPYDGMLKDYVRRHHLEEQVVFAGHLSKEQVRALYHSAHAAVFPVKTQGGWLAPFEALCCGIPVVTSTTMGAASVLREKKFALVNDDLAQALKMVYNSQKQYRELACQAACWIRDHLSWDNFTDTMVAIFEETLESKSK